MTWLYFLAGMGCGVCLGIMFMHAYMQRRVKIAERIAARQHEQWFNLRARMRILYGDRDDQCSNDPYCNCDGCTR